MHLARIANSAATNRQYSSARKVLRQFAVWFREEFGAWPHYSEQHAVLLVVYCQENCDVAVGTVKTYISAWRDLLVTETGASIPQRDLQPWPLLQKVLKGYKRQSTKRTTRRSSVSFINGKFELVLAFYDARHSAQRHRQRLQREPRFRFNRELYRVTMRLLWLFAHKCLLRPDEYSMKSPDCAGRMPRWGYVDFATDGDMYYRKPAAKNDQFGEHAKDIPVCCECPGWCLPCNLKSYKTMQARTFGRRAVAADKFIFKLTPTETVGQSRVYKEWGLIRETLGWDLSHQLYSIRIGRCQDLYALGVEPTDIKKLGCWRSSTFERYLKTSKDDLRVMLRAKTTGVSEEVTLKRLLRKAQLTLRSATFDSV